MVVSRFATIAPVLDFVWNYASSNYGIKKVELIRKKGKSLEESELKLADESSFYI
jgi:hypothetical protein